MPLVKIPAGTKTFISHHQDPKYEIYFENVFRKKIVRKGFEKKSSINLEENRKMGKEMFKQN